MSSSTKANFTRKMNAGTYHQGLFREERNMQETIITRNGQTSGAFSSKATLTTSLASAFDAAFKPKR